MAMTVAERKQRHRLRKRLAENDGALSLVLDEDDFDALTNLGCKLRTIDEDTIKTLLKIANSHEALILPLLANYLISHGHQVDEQNCLLTNNNDSTSEDTMLRSLPIDIPAPTEKPKRGRKPAITLCSNAHVEPITVDSPAYEVAKSLHDIIKARMPDFAGGRKISILRWAKAIKDTIIDKDHRDPKEILGMLSWVSSSKPYLIKRILGPKFLRMQFDSMVDMYRDSKRPRYNAKTGYEIKRTANDKPKKKSVMPDIPHDVRYYELESHWDDPEWVRRNELRRAQEEREIREAAEKARQAELTRIPASRYNKGGELELDENGVPYLF